MNPSQDCTYIVVYIVYVLCAGKMVEREIKKEGDKIREKQREREREQDEFKKTKKNIFHKPLCLFIGLPNLCGLINVFWQL